MQLSHAADDYPAIARRMREISEERRKAEEHKGSAIESADTGLEWLRRTPGTTKGPRRSWPR